MKYLLTNNGYAFKSGERYISIPDPSLYVNDTYIPFEPAGSYQDISVNATLMNNWNPSSGSASWITFSNIVNSGAVPRGWGSFRATAAANSTADRTGTITVISRYNTWEIDVSQNKVVVADSISITPDWQSWAGATEEGVPKAFTLTASGSWTASKTDPDNIITSYSNSGAGSMTVYVTLDNAATKGAKTAYIIYTQGTATERLDVCISGIMSGACAAP